MRISHYLASAGVASRRQSEKIVLSGKVKVNNNIVSNLSIKVYESDRVTVDNIAIVIPKTKLWLYHKPVGLVVSHNDEKGRPTVFDYLKFKLRLNHLISVGRLDLNSEGLLLITNSGEIARELEMPGNLIRNYYVKVHGHQPYETINMIIPKVKNGIRINSINYGPIMINFLHDSCNHIDVINHKYSSMNLWIQVSLTEGKNREIRKIFGYFDLLVSRLIRFQYGPYNLNDLKPNEIKEVML